MHATCGPTQRGAMARSTIIERRRNKSFSHQARVASTRYYSGRRTPLIRRHTAVHTAPLEFYFSLALSSLILRCMPIAHTPRESARGKTVRCEAFTSSRAPRAVVRRQRRVTRAAREGGPRRILYIAAAAYHDAGHGLTSSGHGTGRQKRPAYHEPSSLPFPPTETRAVLPREDSVGSRRVLVHVNSFLRT